MLRAVFDNWKTTLTGLLFAGSLWVVLHPAQHDPWLVDNAKAVVVATAGALGLLARDTQRGHE